MDVDAENLTRCDKLSAIIIPADPRVLSATPPRVTYLPGASASRRLLRVDAGVRDEGNVEVR